MINAAIIKSYPQAIWQIIVHEDHAILSISDSFTYISDSMVTENYSYDRWNAPKHLFKLYTDVRDHRIVPAKKWTQEYRIAEITKHQIGSKRDIEIYDVHIKYYWPGDVCIIYMTNDKFYLNKYGDIMISNMTVSSSNIIGPPCFYSDDTVENLDHLCNHCIALLKYDPREMDHNDIYTVIINARARGLHHTISFSDISINYYEN